MITPFVFFSLVWFLSLPRVTISRSLSRFSRSLDFSAIYILCFPLSSASVFRVSSLFSHYLVTLVFLLRMFFSSAQLCSPQNSPFSDSSPGFHHLTWFWFWFWSLDTCLVVLTVSLILILSVSLDFSVRLTSTLTSRLDVIC